MNLFTLEFWSTALEHALVAGSLAVLAMLPGRGGMTIFKELKAAAIGFAGGSLYAFLKQLGGVQRSNGTLKVSPGKHPSAAVKSRIEGGSNA